WRNPDGPLGVLCHDRSGRKPGSREYFGGKGRTLTLAGKPSYGPGGGNEPHRPSSWRGRREDLRRASPGEPLGVADKGIQDQKQQTHSALYYQAPWQEVGGLPDGEVSQKGSIYR